MTDNTRRILTKSFLIVGLIYLIFHGLAMAKGVLAPIFLAVILAMVLTPVANYLESKGMKKGWAAFFSDLIFVLFVLGMLVAIGAEVQRVSSNWSSIQDRLMSLFEQINSFLQKHSSFSLENPFSQESGQQGGGQQTSGQANNTGQAGASFQGTNTKGFFSKALTWTFSSLTTLLLLVVYTFFMLLYRSKFKKAVLKFIPNSDQKNAKNVLSEILNDAQQYLFGHVILIIVLTVVYTIGFSIAGMQSAFTTALLAAVLTLVPYVGTMIGNIMALGIAFVTTGNLSAVWIVLATVSIGQFLESYFLEPFLVGKRMNVNPLFTLFSVTIGAAVWGIIGMIVFLPLFSFVKAIADHVSFLNPVGYAIGKEDTSEGEGMVAKIKKWFR